MVGSHVLEAQIVTLLWLPMIHKMKKSYTGLHYRTIIHVHVSHKRWQNAKHDLEKLNDSFDFSRIGKMFYIQFDYSGNII